MKWTNIKWIFFRELRDQLRDRRTLFTIFVLPLLLYPLMGMTFLQVAQFTREHQTPVLILGADELPDDPPLLKKGDDGESDVFVSSLASDKESGLLLLDVRDGLPPDVAADQLKPWAQARIKSGDFDAVVYFPDGFRSQLEETRSSDDGESSTADDASESRARPQLFTNDASDKSRIAGSRVERVLRNWRQSIVDETLRSHHIPVAATVPFEVENTDVAREHSRRAAIWSKILPFVVLVWALTGAFYPAIDLCAGEKERGTLETLLCSPAQRSEIVWGKLLTVMSFSMATSILNLCSLGFTGLFIMSRVAQMGGDAARLDLGAPPISAMLWLTLALIPLSGLFSALSLAIAAFARSSKEGQYYLMPLLMITLPLMMLPMLPTAELDLGTALIPVTGVMLLLRTLIEGEYLEALRFAVPVMGITAIGCLLAVRWAIDQFNNESVLFRESERWGLSMWVRHVVRDRQDTPSLAEAVLCGALLLIIHFFASLMVQPPESWSAFATSAVIQLVAFILAPALLMTVVLTRSPRKTLLLNMPRAATLPLAALLAIVLHPAAIGLSEGIQRLYPPNADVIATAQKMEGLFQQAPNIWIVLLVLAVVPAVCEELAFRGFILSGMRHMGHKWYAIVATSVFFGAAHGMLQQSLAACVLGVVIGYLAVQTGSVLPGILFHLTHNALSLLMGLKFVHLVDEYPALEWLFYQDGREFSYQGPVMILSVVCGTMILLWFRNLPYEASAEEKLQTALDHQSIAAPAKSA